MHTMLMTMLNELMAAALVPSQPFSTEMIAAQLAMGAISTIAVVRAISAGTGRKKYA